MKQRKRKAILKLTALVLSCALLLGGAVFWAGRTVFKAVYPMDYKAEIEACAAQYTVPSVLLYAVVHTESGYDPSAVSEAGAMGLTQITPETFRWLQSKTGESLPDTALYEPAVSVRYCALFYSLLLEEFDGDWQTAIAAYHAGRGQVNRWLADSDNSADGKTLTHIPSPVTEHYVHKVLRAVDIYYNLYEKEFSDDV